MNIKCCYFNWKLFFLQSIVLILSSNLLAQPSIGITIYDFQKAWNDRVVIKYEKMDLNYLYISNIDMRFPESHGLHYAEITFSDGFIVASFDRRNFIREIHIRVKSEQMTSSSILLILFITSVNPSFSSEDAKNILYELINLEMKDLLLRIHKRAIVTKGNLIFAIQAKEGGVFIMSAFHKNYNIPE